MRKVSLASNSDAARAQAWCKGYYCWLS